MIPDHTVSSQSTIGRSIKGQFHDDVHSTRTCVIYNNTMAIMPSSRREQALADCYMDHQEGLDILSIKSPLKSSDVFRITFSFFEPSPRFFILHGPSVVLNPDMSQWIAKKNGKQDLIEVARNVSRAFGLLGKFPITLSIHQDEWKLMKYRFHAHLCLGQRGKQRYIEIFKEIGKFSPMKKFWPSKAETFKNNSWRSEGSNLSTDELHDLNVREYPQKSYKSGDLKIILRSLDGLHDDLSGYEHFTDIRYHQYMSQVGLSWPSNFDRDDVDDVVKYLERLELLVVYFRANVQTYDGAHNGGCHMCTGIGPEEFEGFGDSGRPVMGYLQLSGPTYYSVCPVEKRSEWLRRYEMEWDGKIWT